jgi:N,N'-diacetyllegionaminate synthase
MTKFIAECGLNHNGNLDLTYELIRQASWSGADIVKFQLGWRSQEGEINNISEERLDKIINYANYMNIEIMFSVFNEYSYNLVKPYNLNRIKIASRTLIDDFDLVKKIINDKNKVIISLGMWENKEKPFIKNDLIDYLWCVSKYPCLPNDLSGFPKKFNTETFSGYSDHTIGLESALIAISRGANIIEKHFTLDKSDTTIRDHALSVTPDEFRNLVIVGREISKLIKDFIG